MVWKSKKKRAAYFKKRSLITYSNADSLIADQFRTIRTNIKFLSGERRDRIFLITSPNKGEGKSTTTANLAVSIAQQKEKILLIDANLREPVLHRIFEISNDSGLTDILTMKKSYMQVVHSTGIGRLDVLPSGSTLFNPSELLGHETMTNLLNEMVSKYSMVFIDSPTVLKSTEARVLANQCDGVILVLQRGKTELDKAIEAKRVLDLAHARLVGTIINER